MYGCAGLRCCRGLSLAQVRGLLLVAGLGLPPRWLLGAELRSRAQAQLWRCPWFLLGLRGLPAPGIEPMSPALTGGLSTTGPPGESIKVLLKHSEKKSFIPGFQQFIYNVPSRDFLKGYSV